MNLFNEIEPFAAQWTANQYTKAIINARSIRDLSPADVAGFRRVHFFAGIGGWELALRIAGWPEDEKIWTGSCPCQPFSIAGKRGGTDDERHLWPEFFRLVRSCRPRWAMGEQVSSADGLVWLDGVFADLEAEGYTCWAVDTCAAGVEAPHIRQRLYWVAYAQGERPSGVVAERASGIVERSRTGSGRPTDGLANADGSKSRGRKLRLQPKNRDDRGATRVAELTEADRLEHAPSHGWEQGRAEPDGRSVASGCGVGGLGDAERGRQEGRATIAAGASDRPVPSSAWSNVAIIHCRDGKSRPISPESGDEPLAYGIPVKAGHIVAALGELGVDPKIAKRIIANARRNRTGRLRGYGNAIVPQCAVEFVKSVMEA